MNQRTELGLSQKELANLSGVSVSAISMHEQGKRALPKRVQDTLDIIDKSKVIRKAEPHLTQTEFEQILMHYDKRINDFKYKMLELSAQIDLKKCALHKINQRIDHEKAIFNSATVIQKRGGFPDELMDMKNDLSRMKSLSKLFYKIPDKIFELETFIEEKSAALEVYNRRLDGLIREKEEMIARNVGAIHESPLQESSGNESAVNKSSLHESRVHDSFSHELPVIESIVNDPFSHELPVNESIVNDPFSHELPVIESIVNDPFSHELPVNESSVNESTVAEDSVGAIHESPLQNVPEPTSRAEDMMLPEIKKEITVPLRAPTAA